MRINIFLIILFIVSFTTHASISDGSVVSILENSHTNVDVAEADSELNNFYNLQAGITSNIFSSTVTSAQLAGADMFVSILPDDSFLSSEITVMTDFLGGGGTILFMGENQASPFSLYNARINSALSALGSNMSLVAPSVSDNGYRHATVSNGQVLTHDLTSGITAFEYAAPSAIAGIVPSNTLFLMSDLSTGFIGVESLLGGRIILSGDTSITNGLFGTSNASTNNDNDIFFMNLLPVQTVVPEPVSSTLFIAGGASLGFWRWRKKKSA